ncbi:IQ calmodulin-binding motif protein (macronuclear) [Tetrahymena thermophila SB210]|uniref:IQ calmodulin-binding motif protein n=1 Tax=Tetrahymena thermophila (strain SB210) TaxID=312017 RepID=Q24IA3_TETTS|nr:IQ calmodulin-binding motif protein [Tetrahymena thermophila SB210]EAS07494.2 IQ calmodulin-binding motif protein [Tetrahymena thermophila SB210]|eukprot:XP_001027736.2 IQ calmodulin-binding motif protein [Tetrahymena thermophila SB210]
MSINQPVFHYKSAVTLQKLQDFQSRPLDPFDLENIDQFEQKFKNFSLKFQQETFPETLKSNQKDQSKPQRRKTIHQKFASQDSLFSNTVTTTLHNIPQQNNGILKQQKSQKHLKTQSLVSFEEPLTVTLNQSHQNSKKDQPLNGLIDQKFKLMLQKNTQKENPVVQYFGNQLIATVFQSLIIKTIEEKFHIKINMDCDIPISSNVLKMFDLSTVVINNLKGFDSKMDYIYSTMCKKVDTLLQNFDEKTNQKEATILKQESKFKQQIKSVQADHFTWLKLKASHDTLKKKLRQMIVEKLIEYENLLKIQEVIEKKQNLKDEGKLDDANKTFSDLKNLKLISSKEVFKNMSTYGNHKIKLYLSRLGITKYPDEKHPTSKINKLKSKRSNSEDKMFVYPYEQDSSNKNKLNQSQLLNQTTGIKGFQNEEMNEENYWTQEREDEFQKYRSQKKFIYSNEVVSSNWNDVGFLPFVQRYILEYKKSIQRDTLLDRYQGGEWLTEDELKFLANTSELLNSCVDKDFMQKAVNIVNPDLIDNMELGLAEQILSNYEDAKQAIKKARQKFINQKQEQQQEWLRDQYEKAQNQIKKIQNAKFYRRYYRIFTVLLDKMEKEQKFADKLPENIHGAEYLNQYLLGNSSEKDTIQKIYKVGKLNEYEFKRYIQRKKQEKEEKQESDKQAIRFKKLSKPISYTNDEFIKNMKRRKYHPSSKIFIEKHNSSSDEDLRKDLTIEQQEQKRYNSTKKSLIKKQEIEKYELNLKTVDLLKEKQNFKTFYSGGPQKQQNQLTIYDRYRATGKNIATQQEMRSILIIQKRFRAFLKRKQLVQFLRANQIKKDYQYKHIIDQIQMNPNQIHLIMKDTFNPAKPSIDDIQLQISKKHHSQQVRGSFLRNMSRSNSMISAKGGDRSFTFMSQKHTRNPSLNILVPQNQNHQDQNKSPLTENISPIIEKITYINPSTPINQSKSPQNQALRSNSGHNNQKFIQLNQGSNHYFSSYLKMQQEMAETYKRIQAQSASQNFIQNKAKSEYHDNLYGNEAVSTQFSTNKKQDHTFANLSSHFAENNNKDYLNSKQSVKSDEDEDETGDKCDINFQRSNNHQQSPTIKINQQTFNNNLYQQKRASLLFKIPSSAVKINKYIDTKNVIQQFALKELLMPKTPKENLLLSNKNLQQKAATSKITDAFNKKQNESIQNFNKIDRSYSQLISHNNSTLPSSQISQFLFQTPTSSAQTSQKAIDKVSSQNQISCLQSSKQIENTFQPSHDNSSEQQEINNSSLSSEMIPNIPPQKIPNVKDLDPPLNYQRPTIKQQRLLAAAAENKLQLIINSGFIFYENDLNVRDMQGNTPLHLAAKNSHFQFASWLLSKKANPNLRNINGWTPLHFAFQANKLEGVMLIQTHGGDLNILNKKGETPLALGSQKLLSLLGLQKGVVNVRQDEESFQKGYLNSFNNNALLEKKNKYNEFVNGEAQFQANKLKSNFQKIVTDKNVNSFN